MYKLLILLIIVSCSGNSQKFNEHDIIYKRYDSVTSWNLIQSKKTQKWGFIDNENLIKIPVEYDDLFPFTESNVSYALKNGKYGFINSNNEIVVPFQYQFDNSNRRIYSFGLMAVRENGKFGYVDKAGSLVIPLKYDSGEYFTKNGLAEVSLNKKYGFINRQGQEVIPVIYEMVKSEQLDNLVIVRKNYKWAFFNNEGKQLSDFLYTDVQRAWKNDRTTFFENGPASVKQNGKYSFINKNLKPAFSNMLFDSATSFDSNRNAIVMNKGKFVIVKDNGKIAVPLQYDLVENFNSNGNPNPRFYRFEKGNIQGLFNKNLKKIAESKKDDYSSSFSLQGNYISFENFNGKYGLIDEEGNEKIPFVYDADLYFDRNDFSIAKKNNRFGIIDINNQELIPFNYNEISQIDADENIPLFVV
ncbi:WG repeat-containing protein [Kaistella flava (ex Peng et al. 2021)]|uniref:WG repeat-containing protein n=1 Tax=Kaistella flava (ex Peng et al. 2021) TaxID=2038776 RepID=A0A7M2YCK2_9FLAO|nr:WG repeat-containing protein [Kaistella flava (ex Peng et al. 2021)]QOW11182.1 WG repeat-containing protein [Kaistella flava (ex Peng et al. 2021)]